MRGPAPGRTVLLSQGLARVSSSPEQRQVQGRLQGTEPVAGLPSVLVPLKVLCPCCCPFSGADPPRCHPVLRCGHAGYLEQERQAADHHSVQTRALQPHGGELRLRAVPLQRHTAGWDPLRLQVWATGMHPGLRARGCGAGMHSLCIEPLDIEPLGVAGTQRHRPGHEVKPASPCTPPWLPSRAGAAP